MDHSPLPNNPARTVASALVEWATAFPCPIRELMPISNDCSLRERKAAERACTSRSCPPQSDCHKFADNHHSDAHTYLIRIECIVIKM